MRSARDGVMASRVDRDMFSGALNMPSWRAVTGALVIVTDCGGDWLAPDLQIRMDVSVSTSTQEMTMSQKTQQDRDQERRRAPTQNVRTHDKPITGLSPDDDVGLPSDNPSKPGDPMK